MGIAKKDGGMGFKDLHSFNKVLLAKQSWRLWKTLDSFLSKIMEGKYYPGGYLLKAPLSTRLSFAWRSIHGYKGWKMGKKSGFGKISGYQGHPHFWCNLHQFY